jgi:hypothetical protein
MIVQSRNQLTLGYSMNLCVLLIVFIYVIPGFLLVNDDGADTTLVPQHVRLEPDRHEDEWQLRRRRRREAAEDGVQAGTAGQLAAGGSFATGSSHDDVGGLELESSLDVFVGSR